MIECNNSKIVEKPLNVSWEVIHDILQVAHCDKNKEGGVQITARYSGVELKEKVGKGKCFVALLDDKVVGTCSVSIREREFWFGKGCMAYYMFDAVLPSYQGYGIYSKLEEARDKYIISKEINLIYTYTSYHNKKMHKIKKHAGFRLVGFFASQKTDYYSVILAKWIGGCPFPKWYCHFRYVYSMIRVRLHNRNRF